MSDKPAAIMNGQDFSGVAQAFAQASTSYGKKAYDAIMDFIAAMRNEVRAFNKADEVYVSLEVPAGSMLGNLDGQWIFPVDVYAVSVEKHIKVSLSATLSCPASGEALPVVSASFSGCGQTYAQMRQPQVIAFDMPAGWDASYDTAAKKIAAALGILTSCAIYGGPVIAQDATPAKPPKAVR